MAVRVLCALVAFTGMWAPAETFLLQGTPTIGHLDLDNFDETNNGLEFIFHDDTDLFLTINNDHCFFMDMDEDMEDKIYSLHDREQFESDVGITVSRLLESKHHLTDIHHGARLRVRPSSLDEVRDIFQDRLADFHCLDKAVYTLSYHAGR